VRCLQLTQVTILNNDFVSDKIVSKLYVTVFRVLYQHAKSNEIRYYICLRIVKRVGMWQ